MERKIRMCKRFALFAAATGLALLSWAATGQDILAPATESFATNGVEGSDAAPAGGGRGREAGKSDKGKAPFEALLNPAAVRIAASKPVTMNDAKFVTVAQARWQLGKKGKSVAIDIQLQITNVAETDINFPTFDSFGLVIRDQKGKEIEHRGGRLATRFTPPVLLPPGVTYSLGAEGSSFLDRRRAELAWNEEQKACELVYCDGSGWTSRFGPLDAGTYELGFWYAVRAGEEEPEKGHPASWSGKVRTQWAVIEVVPAKLQHQGN
jgi:hypothetical protein